MYVSPLTIGHVRWVPCHHGMARHQCMHGEDALLLWKVAAYMLNKQRLIVRVNCKDDV
jgi:hypothetical protein